MRSIFSALFIALTIISNVRADEITKIEKANLICSKSGGAVFINVADKRLWQGDSPKDKEGLELKVDSFNLARCPNCYTVEGRFSGMEATQSIRYAISGVPGTFKKAKLIVSAIEKIEESGTTTTTETEVTRMNCKVK